jgi:hypothetical protein
MLDKVFDTTNKAIGNLTKVLLGLTSLGVLAEVIFGAGVFGSSIVGNIVNLISTIGNNGFVGLLALIVLVALFKKD